MGGSWTSWGSRGAFAPRGATRAAVLAPLLLLLATCQVDKLTNSPPPIARLMLAPGQVRDSAPVGSMAAAADSVSVANGGPGTLSWVAHLQLGESWLAFVGPNSGTAPATLRLAFNPAGLAMGVYRDTVIVDAENAANSPGRVPVEFTVHPCMPAPIVVNAPPLTDSLTTSDCSAPHRPTSFARLYAFTAAAGDSISIAMGSSAFDSYVVLDSSTGDAAPPFATNDSCSGGSDACLRYLRLPAAGTYRVEATSAGAGQTGRFTLSVTRPRVPAAAQSLAQLRSDSVTAIPIGGTTDQGTVVLRGLVTDPDVGDSLRLQVELQAVGTAFTGTPTVTGARVANGQTAFVAATGLANNAAYHWQARALDQTGRAGSWTAFGGNLESTADFSTSIPVPPNAPTTLQQFQGDNTTLIPPGGTATGRSVIFKANVSDPNPSDQIHLEVEVQTMGVAFTGNANGFSGAPVGNPGVATATFVGLADSTSYHWQARAVDQTGRAGPWVPFAAAGGGTTPDFRVAIAVTQLAFTVQPSNTGAGSVISPAVQVTAKDASGNTVTSFNGTVTIALGANPAGGTLAGTLSAVASQGVAVFSDLSIARAASGYTLQASATTGTGTTLSGSSNAFTITPGAATHLTFTVQPVTTAAGAAITPAVQVAARDAFENTATGFTGDITVTLAANPTGATLAGSTVVAASAGVATFSTLSLNKAGTGYTLSATAAGQTGAMSAAFDVTPASASRLVFSVQPTAVTAGVAITPAVQVSVQDAQGNTATGFSGNITVAIGANPGAGTLSGTTTVAAASGVATFSTLSINRTGSGYTLTASASGLSAASSASFDVAAGAATQLTFTVQPTSTTAGSVITPAVRVVAQDALGNTATTFAGNVTVGLGANPGGSLLGGTTTTAAVAGVATFGNLSLDKTGSGYTLTVAATGLTGQTSASFTISAAAANKLIFTVQPSNVSAGASVAPAVQVTAEDGLGNTVTTFTGSVTVALGNNPGGGTLGGVTNATAVAGVATFSGLTVDKVGTGYSLTAVASGLTTASSTAFNVTPGAASQLVFSVQPSATVAGAGISPAVQVTAQDAHGNTATAFSGNVTVTIGTNAGGGTLSGTATVAATAGLATFPGLSINRAGVGYTLTAGGSGLTGATSAAFNVSAGAASTLVFSVQPGNATAGSAITPAVRVTALDADGNIATGFTGNVTVAIGANPGGGALSGTVTTAAASGVATFANLSINRTGTGYTVTAATSGVTSATSAAFNITPGPASALVFTVQPSNATAGATITPAVQVTAQDAQGNVATGFGGNVSVALGANPGGGTLLGAATVGAVNGVAAFSGLSINKAGAGYTLTATATGLTTNTSAPFTITVGALAQLTFTVQPANAVAGASIAPAVQVTGQDAQGNTVTTFSGNVTVALGTNPGGGTLSGTTTVTAASGVATFTGLSINKAGTGYTLTAAASGLNQTSTPFNITPGAASQLVFTVAPGNTTAGAAITPAVQVTAQDAQGNTATGFSGTVTVAIGANPGGGVLSGTAAVTAVSGVATFAGLSINRAGAGYTLAATASNVSGTSSPLFNITAGTATQLVFSIQPSNTVAGVAITPAVQVTALDAIGNTDPTFAGKITVALGANPGAGTLSGTTSVAAVSGAASFPGLSIDRAAAGYSLTADAGGLPPVTSSTFAIAAGAASHLAFSVQPSNTTAGAPITPAIQVTALDALGNIDPGFAGNITVAVGTNPGGATLSGTTTVAAASGVATFSGLSLDKVGSGYSLTANGGALTGATSTSFNVAAGSASQLVFTAQPTSTTAGSVITPAVQVTAQDAQGNTVTAFTGSVTVALAANPGGGTLAGTKTVAAVAGVATFGDLSLDKAGTGYTLTAAATGVSTPTSAAFTISPAAANKLVFTVQPSNVVAGATIAPAVQVTTQDNLGNTVTSFSGNVTVALGNNPAGGTLAGTVTVAAVSGVATFSGLSVNKAGTGYTLTAAATGLTTGSSAAFNVTPGAASQLIFTVQPTTTAAAAPITPAIQVTAQDAQGNTATTFTGNVTLTIGTNPGSGTLSGTATVAAVGGVASFSGMTINKTGTGYTLTAAASSVTPGTSATFNITPGPAAQVVFSVQPSNATAGAPITPAVQVTVQDAEGNTATQFSSNVTVALGTNPASGTLSGTTTVAAAAGVATFPGLSINRPGTGYTLAAAATGIATKSSATFNIAAGAATQLVFTVQPSAATAGAAITPAVQVTAQDALGNTDPTFAGNVTIAIGTNPGGGALAGTTTVTAASGVATFANLSINKVGTGYTLSAAATGLPTQPSTAFNVTPGTATQLVFSVEPTNATAGAAITPAVQVTALDGQGNVATGFAGTVAMAIGSNPGGGTLAGTTSVVATSGVATFANLSINKVGSGYTLAAAATGVTSATSTAFNVTVGAATQLIFSVQPGITTAGVAITPAVQVTAQDAQGNTATQFVGNVTVALGANPGSGTLSGTTTVAAAAGIATFNDLSINKTASGYTLTAAASGLNGGTSTTFAVTPGAGTQLVFTVPPTSTVAGATITPAVQVTVEDAQGNTATGFSGNVTAAIGSNPGGGSLSGTTTVAAANGVATFANLSIDKVGTGYTLTAAATGLPTVPSAVFNIAAGGAARLAFSVQPSNATAGAAITPAVQVTAQDAQGNTATAFSGNVTVAIGTNAGGGTLSGTATVAAVSGVATFANLAINKVGTGYTLSATASGVTAATSGAFNITVGTASQLVFTVQPSNAAAGAPITPAVQVTAQDAQGNTATGFTGTVTVAIGTNPGSGALSGTASVPAANGVATFANLSINKVGSGYTLTASATSMTSAPSAAFNITAGTASQLVFTVQPSNTVAGASITPAVQVTAQDAQGNPATGFAGNVTIALGTNPGSGTLSGTTTVAAVSGVATFANLSINKVGTGYALSATATGMTATPSAAFNITAGTASQLAFTVQPSGTTAGAAITPAVQVTAQDAQGNTATAFTGNLTVALGANPGSGTLSGSTSVAAVAGVATFSGLSINKAGAGYTLTANATGVTGTTSGAFNITSGSATQLVFTVQPTNTAAGASITPALQVAAQDALGNTDPSFTGNVTVALGANPGSGTLSGTTTVAAVAGVATFPGLSINKVGSGYTVTSNSGSLSGATSTPFTVTAGAATQLSFSVQPSNTVAGATITPAVQVTALDGQGNTATGFTGSVTVALGANPGSGTLSGTTAVSAAAGVATFSGLSINKAGTGYTLTASATGASGTTSAAFTITPGAASQLVFSVQPSNAAAGTAIAPAVQVTAQDALGNTATQFTGSVTVALGANPGSGTLSGTATVAAAAGVATFADLSVNKSGTGYTLTAASGSLTPATSTAFNVTPGAPSQAVFTVQPTNTSAGAVITPAVQVTVEDAQGNTAIGFSGNVTVAIGTNPSGGSLSGTTTVAATGGVATFSTLSIDKVGTGYTLTAAPSGVPAIASAPFNIGAGAAARLVFSVQPSNATAGAGITPSVQLTAQDAQGNTATAFTGTVTVAIGANPGGGTLGGTTAVAASGGVATFPGLTINRAGAGYTLAASATGVTTATSALFNITPGSATQLVFTVQPTSTAAGASITPAVQLTAEDGFGNPDPNFTGNVTVAIGANPGSGTLSGTTTVGAVSGVATFPGLSVDKSGTGYTLSGTATGLTTATSAGFNVTAGAAAQLVFTVEPSNVTATQAITPAVQVTARDAQGNTATGFTGTVTVAIGANPGGGVLAGTTSVAAVSGVATFSNLSINKAGTGYTVTAAASGPAGVTSSPFDVSPGAATHLTFSVPPSTTPANAMITPPIQVSALDASNNVATGFSGNVAMAIPTNSNPGNGTLSGTKPVAAVAGVATFSDLSINNPGTGYRLRATSTGLTGVTSGVFNITAVTQLVFTVQPGNIAAGGTISPAVQVTAEDAAGRVATGFTGSVTVAIGANPGGGTLSGTKTVAAAGGVASFADLSIDKAGTGYTLTATATGLTTPTSSPFNVSAGGATHLAFAVQPSNAVAGAAIAPAVQLVAQDAQGNTDPTFTGNITVAFGANPGGGALSGTTTVAAVNGVAAFSTLSINKTGTGYALAGSATGLTGATSATFNVSAAAASSIALNAGDNQSATAGTGVATPPSVVVRDQFGNPVAGITVTFAAATGGGSVTGPSQVTNASGIAAVGSWTLGNTAGTNTLTATAAGLTGSPVTFTATGTAGAPTQIAVSAGNNQSATVGTNVATPPAVLVQDAHGNPVAGVAVTFAVASGGGTVNPTTAVTTGTDGIAAVTSWTLGTTAGPNALTATSGSLNGSPVTFTATGTAAGAGTIAVNGGNNQSATVNTAVAIVPSVIVRDQFNNPVAGVAVTFAVATGGGTVSPTTAVTTGANGIAQVTSWTLGTTAGTNTLTATAGSVGGSPVTFTATGTAGAASSIAINAGNNQSATVSTAVPTPPSVIVRDAFSNPVSGVSVTFAVASGGGSVNPTSAVTSGVNGIAQVTSWTLGPTAGTNTLTATSGSLSGSPVTFTATATAGAATQIAISAGNNQSATAGTNVATAPAVLVQDAHGNPVAGVTVTFAVASGGGTVNPTTVPTTGANGIAQVTSWTLGTTAGTNTLTATSSGLAGSPVTFTATGTAGPAASMVKSSGDNLTGQVATKLQTPHVVLVSDANGNPVSGVTVTWAAASGGGSVDPATSTTDVNGHAQTFRTLGILIGTQTTTATATIGGTATTVTFTSTATAAGASQMSAAGGDGQTGTVGTTLPTQLSVRVADPFNNPVAGVTVTWTPASGSGSVNPTTSTTNTSGIAATTWTLGPAAGTQSVQATAAGSPVTFTATATAGSATQIAVSAGNNQSATAGTNVATPPAVLVQDAHGNPVAGVGVTFAVASGGGTANPTTPVTTGANGIAQVTSWTLGNAAGSNTLTATSSGLTGSPVTFTATGTAGAATQIAISAGNNQSATVGTNVATAPAVLAQDVHGNPVAGVAVTFTVTSGGGTVNPTTPVTTGANGIAQVTAWTLGTAAGQNTLTATATGLNGSPLTFTATATAGAASSIAINTGNNQSATVNSAVSTSPSVIVRDAFSNPVSGVGVTFAVASGGGTVNPTSAVTTGVNGIAQVTSWTLGTTAGQNTLTATATGLSGSPVTFTATGTAGAASSIAINAGNTQTATVGTAVATPPSVIVRDPFGNPVSGVGVTFAVASGGGTVNPTSAVTTGVNGIAEVTSWTLGNTAGANSLTATSGGLSGSPVTFTATATAGAASSITINAGNNQTATVGTAVATNPSVIVRDASNNPVAGVSVTFAVASGGGSVNPTTAVTTGQNGIAQVTAWTLGTTAGQNSLTATSGGLSGSPVTFTATGTSGAAASIAINAGNNQSTTVGTAVATAPSAIVRDQFGNSVGGVAVTFAVASGGGSVTGASQTTTAGGIATVGSWTLGPTAGSNTLNATSATLSGSPVTFTATGTAGAATQIAINAGNNQSGTVGTAVATAPSVIVKDAFNNPVAGVAVTFAVASGGGSVTGASQTTDASGIATVASWTLGTAAGTNTLTATSGSLSGSPLTFTATGTAGQASSIAINAGNNQSTAVGTAVATPPSVIVKDASNNPVAGVSVTFAVATGGGSVTGPSQTTNASGIATVGSWTLGSTAGSNTLTATSGSLSGSPVTFTATGTAGTATQIAINAGNNQSATVGTPVATSPSVIVQDAHGNPVAGVNVTFAVGSGGGTVTPTTPVTTGTNGIAQVTSWTLGSTAGPNTLTATSTGLTGSPVTFSATGTAGTATQIAINAGNNQSATVGTAVATSPSVIVKDASNNPVAGVSVTFAVASGGGSVTGASATTDANGIATVGSWTLGTTAGTNTLTATSGTLTGSPVTFTATGTAGVATQIALNAGNNQSATVGTPVATPPSVLVQDGHNNPVAGVAVTFAVTGGGGTVNPTSAVTTGTNGIAAVTSWTLGSTTGQNTLAATATGLSGSPLTFTATGTAGAATQIALNAGNNQSATVATAVATPPSVIVKDGSNNPVAGVNVTFAVATGGGSVTGASQTTNASGIATVGTWTLGGTAGSNTLTATSGSLTGGPVTFTATGTADAATQIAISAGNNQSATVGTAVATAPSVLVQDAHNNPVAGVNVTFAVATGGGSLTGGSQTTSTSGIATVGSWTLGNTAGSNTLTATSGSLSGSPVTFTATGTAGAASSIALNGGNNQAATVGTGVTTAPSVIVKDASNNPVSGVAVTFAVASGGGSVSGASQTTDGSGIATVGSWTLGNTAGSNTLTATSGSLSGSPVTFTATGTAGPASTLAINGGNNQSATVNSTVTIPPSVVVRDQFGNGVAGVSVSFAVASGGGSVTGSVVTTDAGGVASVGSWTLGTVAGANTLTATSGTLGGSPVSFNATGTPDVASSLVYTVEPSTTKSNTPMTPAVVVTVLDQFGNTATGFNGTVTLTITPLTGTPGATLSNGVVSASSGVATFSNLTIDLLGVGYELDANASAVAGVTSTTFDITL